MKLLHRKLHFSVIAVLSGFGLTLVLVNATIAIHDAIAFFNLPAEYRNAISRLEKDWHYEGLSSTQQDAILQVHKKWQDEGLLPWWGADQLVNSDKQREEVLTNFRTHVPAWGTVQHQRHPFLLLCISLVGFIPLLAYLGIAKWIRWLRHPQAGKKS
jgi:hypothetical protein